MPGPDLIELDGWLTARETQVGGVRPGCEKRIVWADGPRQTDFSVVYVHGFSATGEEIRPVPDKIADALGANLFFTRLAGHGQDGTAMARATLTDWTADVKEAFDIGATLGKETVLIGCSTGCTLIASALAEGATAKAVVFVSPNFGLRNMLAQRLIDLPAVRRWGPYVAGKTRSFEAMSEAHAAYWTLHYDTQAVFTMGEAVRAARHSNLAAIDVPAYVAYARTDQVVSADRTEQTMARWGAEVRYDVLQQNPNDDAMGHLMAGDIFSPGQTDPLVTRVLDWLSSR